MPQKSLVVILGPTAVGKTGVSIELAKWLQTEIISCDSRQFYKEATIGTAKPTQEELKAIPHHFINSRSVSEPYNAGAFATDAVALLDQLFKKNDTVLMTGGSGLYINAVCNGFDNLPEANEDIRKQLESILLKEGINGLGELLKKHDPVFYHQVDKANPHRMIRALEVCLISGLAYSSFRKGEKTNRNFEVIKTGLCLERKELYDRINDRVDHMMIEGLLEEVKSLVSYKQLNALQTVGYKELFDHLEGKTTLEEAISLIKQNTRRFAKRQLTWFRRDTTTEWFNPSQVKEIKQYIGARCGVS